MRWQQPEWMKLAAEKEAAAEPAGQITCWLPEQDRIRLAILGKLAEECNELAGRAARCIVQGIDERDPATGRTNREEMAREIADVYACIDTVQEHLAVHPDGDRFVAKRDGYLRWHRMIREAQP